MAQLTLRLSEELADELRAAAAARGQSLNAWATAVLRAAVDPDLAGDEAERVRARLARAGLLSTEPPQRAHRPSRRKVDEARAAAGRGRRLSDIVTEER